MSLQNRIATCDVCGCSCEEIRFGVGFPGWAVINGIGACAPEPGQPQEQKHTQLYLCPDHKEVVSGFIDQLQRLQEKVG